MATANFHVNNASRYFAIGMNHYTTKEEIEANGWEGIEEGSFDEEATQWDYECTKEYLHEELEKAGYDGEEKEYSFDFAGCTFEICMKVVENVGYYEGSCLDYEANLKCYDNAGYYVADYDLSPSEYIDADELQNEDLCNNKGMSRLQAKNMVHRIDKEFLKLVNELEQIFSKVCEVELQQVCRFSNGEAWYNKVSEPLYKEKVA